MYRYYKTKKGIFMKEFITAFDDSFKTSSKIIVSESNGKSYSTLKNVSSKDFKEALKQHFLGIKRLGVSPEIKSQEDLILFAGIDIDGKAKKDSKELSTEEKYQIALNLQKAFFEKYKINTLIEQSKSKGFHLFVFFKNPVNRNLIQKILENLVTEVTDRTITNGDIEIFPKGKKGLALNLPYFGLFKNENTINENFYELKKSCFVEGKNMEAIKNPLEKIETCKNNNLSTLLLLESLKDYPLCVTKAALNWTEGERNSLTLAIAGVLKKVSKVSVGEAIDIITKIIEYNNDEELSSRIATIESTYANDNKDIAACSIMNGSNKNLVLSQIFCQTHCSNIKTLPSIKAQVRAIQTTKDIKGVYQKDKIAELIISELLNLGKLYKANNLYYIFLKEDKRLICISDEPLELKALFTKWGINASENLYKYILNELYVYCISHAEQVDIHRFAYFNPKTFFLYLYNGKKEILKISSNKIEIIENGDDGVMFMELNNYEPFKIVEFDNKIDYVEKYLTDNLNIDKDASMLNLKTQNTLAKIWFYSLFFESILKTKPIFAAIGNKGSGKTTFLRRVGQILFGKKFDVTSVGNDCKDIDTIITNNYYVVIDNLDNPTKALNDTLARIATGQVIKKRKLFTTNIELEFEVKCFVALTSRTPQFTRDDVADRLICIYLERFGLFQDENNLCRKVMDNRDKIFSFIVAKLQKIIKKLENKQNEEYKVDFRMADFAVFALKIAENKREQTELEKIFATMIKIQNEFTLRDDVLYLILKEFVKNTDNKGKRFTPAQLYKKFKEKADEMGLLKSFEIVYKNPKSVSTRLRNIKDNISDEILMNYEKGHSNQFYYSFELVDDSEYQDSLI